jgi:hypothetical protein
VEGSSRELLLALCHEVGNLLAAARLHSHLLDEDSGAQISQLAGRAGSLVALVRPLLTPAPERSAPLAPRAVLAGLRRGLDDSDASQVRIDVESAADLPDVAIDGETLHHLLLSQIFAALEERGIAAPLGVAAEARGDGVAFVIEDGPSTDAESEAGGLHGPALGRALGRAILGARGGRVETQRRPDGARTAYVVRSADAC